MKTALVTTTINVPTVLQLLHAHDPDVGIFVAGDLKTPEPQCADFVNTLGPNAYYLSVEKQKSFGYACSDLIGWNCIQRRNIATLEALKWGADILVFWDDDNIPMNTAYFGDFQDILERPFSGISVSNPDDWADPGFLLSPAISHRGVPLGVGLTGTTGVAVGAKVGVVAGLCLGDPDIGAIARIALRPAVGGVCELADAGVVIASGTKTVFNSQNTAFIRELAPAAFLMPGLGRYDDIWMSLIMQRVMRERGYHVHFGRPYIWQARNPHNLLNDLKAEMFGMERTQEFGEWLGSWEFGAPASPINLVRGIYTRMRALEWFPLASIEAGEVWCDDIEKVL